MTAVAAVTPVAAVAAVAALARLRARKFTCSGPRAGDMILPADAAWVRDCWGEGEGFFFLTGKITSKRARLTVHASI